jgi:hypothetical protein
MMKLETVGMLMIVILCVAVILDIFLRRKH